MWGIQNSKAIVLPRTTFNTTLNKNMVTNLILHGRVL